MYSRSFKRCGPIMILLSELDEYRYVQTGYSPKKDIVNTYCLSSMRAVMARAYPLGKPGRHLPNFRYLGEASVYLFSLLQFFRRHSISLRCARSIVSSGQYTFQVCYISIGRVLYSVGHSKSCAIIVAELTARRSTVGPVNAVVNPRAICCIVVP